MTSWVKEWLRYTRGYLAVGGAMLPFALLYALGAEGYEWAHLLNAYAAGFWLASKAWNRVVYGHKHSVILQMNHATATKGVLLHCSMKQTGTVEEGDET